MLLLSESLHLCSPVSLISPTFTWSYLGIIRVFLRQSCSGDVYWPHDFNMKMKRVMQTPNICWNVYQLLFWVAKFLGIQNILWPFDLWGRIFTLWQVYRKKGSTRLRLFPYPNIISFAIFRQLYKTMTQNFCAEDSVWTKRFDSSSISI